MGAFAGGGKRSFDVATNNIEHPLSRKQSLLEDLISNHKIFETTSSSFEKEKLNHVPYSEESEQSISQEEDIDDDYLNQIRRKILLYKIFQKLNNDYDSSNK